MATTPEIYSHPGRNLREAGRLIAVLLLGAACLRSFAASPAVGTPLLQPTSVAYDATGNLYFAESRNHVIRRVDMAGQLTTVAGTSVQGFGGDGGPATAAELDSPRGVALDAQGNLYIADTHNHRIRCVDAVTHQIRTLAGTGLGSFSGDGGPAVAASVNTPMGLALDGSNHLYIADSGNNRLRVVDLSTGLITTIAGTGQQGFSGDNGPAVAATFNAPSGLAADNFGNIFISDTGNHRIREVSSATRKVVTLAGDGSSGVRLSRPEGLSLDLKGGLLISDAGTNCIYLFNLASGRLSIVAGQGQQAFQGDQGLATLAMLDSPDGVAFDPGGLITVADTNNGRLRQISSESGGTVTTIAGLGSLQPSALLLSFPAVQAYGSTVITTTFSSATLGSGLVRLADVSGGNTQLLAATALTGSSASFSLSGLNVGTHLLLATYAGDLTHEPSQSAIVAVTITPLPVVVALSSATTVYGQPLPSLTGTLTGVLPQDQASVKASFAAPDAAFPLSPGSYPLAAALTGSAAGNYVLTGGGAALTVTQAPTAISVSHDSSGFLISVASSTSGKPTGAVTLMTSAGSELASIPVSTSGQTFLSDSGLTAGTYSVVAIYSGDTDFLAARSLTISATIGGVSPAPATPDFSIASTGGAAQTAQPGGTATFNFAVTAGGQAMAGPIALTVQGAPSNSSATFTPPLVTPGTTAASVALNVILPRSSAAMPAPASRYHSILALLLPMLLLPLSTRRRLRNATLGVVSLALVVVLAGCGDRIAGTAATGSSAHTYSLLVTGTTTRADGSSLQHSTTVTLTVP